MHNNIFIKLGILFIAIGLVVFPLKVVCAYINDYNKDVERSREIAKSINDNYEVFNNYVNEYKEDILKVYGLFDVYLEDFEAQNTSILFNISNINANLDKILAVANVLYKSCYYDLSDNLLESKCDMFHVNYKGMIDSYKSMIDNYNDIVNLYNFYALKNGKFLLSLYVINLNDDFYIIYDNK